jgi:hypothetical protein
MWNSLRYSAGVFRPNNVFMPWSRYPLATRENRSRSLRDDKQFAFLFCHCAGICFSARAVLHGILLYGPTFAARGVTTGIARPMNFDTVLLPLLVVHTEPEESIATPTGLLSPP